MPLLDQTAAPPMHTASPAASAQAPAHVRPGQPLRVESHGYQYIVLDNKLLTPAQVAQALQRGDTPKAAVGALKQAYAAKGYFLVALVGQAKDRQVVLKVVQGRLTHVNGKPQLTRFFNGLKGDDKIKNSDVIRQSIWAQSYAATNNQQPQISFQPAPEVGGSTMDITEKPVPDSRNYGGSLTTGNFGNRYAGHYLAQAQGYLRGDGFTFQASHSRALTGLDKNTHGAFYAATNASLSAVTPLGSFQLDGSDTRFKLGQALAPVYPAGRIRTYGLSATQLIYADDQKRWSVQEGVHHIRDEEDVFKGIYKLRDQRYTVWDASTDFSWRFGGLFKQAASLSLSGGVKLGGTSHDSGFVDTGPGSPQGHFQLYTASASVVQSLGHDYSVQFSLSGQSSPDTLPSYQQWVLGGLNNLTAYLPGTIVGDRGYLGRLTLQGPQWKLGFLQVRPSLFGEYGASRYSYVAPGAATWQSLDDVGAGLGFNLPSIKLSGTLAYAKPLGSRNVPAATREGQQAHTYFYLQWAL